MSIISKKTWTSPPRSGAARQLISSDSTMSTEQKFIEKNSGKWIVRQAGILVRRAFDTAQSATNWAEHNYRIRSGWRVEKI